MKKKLLEIFESLNLENQEQILDYAIMLWEMEQGENQLKERLGFEKLKLDIDQLPFIDKNDPKNIN